MSSTNPQPLGGEDSITCARCWRVHTECHLEPAATVNAAKAAAYDEGEHDRFWRCVVRNQQRQKKCCRHINKGCGWRRLVREVDDE